MTQPKTNDWERMLHEMQKIERQIAVLKDFCISRIEVDDNPPQLRGVVDPRTGELFQKKKREVTGWKQKATGMQKKNLSDALKRLDT